MCHVRDTGHDVTRQLPFNREVPGLNVARLISPPHAPRTHVDRRRRVKTPVEVSGSGMAGIPLSSVPMKANGGSIQRSILWLPGTSAQGPRKWQRIVGDAIAAADHCILVHSIGEPKARGKQLLAGCDPGVIRVAADAAHVDQIRRWIPALDAPVFSTDQRVVFIPQTDVEGQLAAHLPAVADEPPKLPFPVRHLEQLNRFLHRCREPEQERGVGVEVV